MSIHVSTCVVRRHRARHPPVVFGQGESTHSLPSSFACAGGPLPCSHRCTGYRPILDAAASFTPTAGSSADKDIEDLGACIPLSKDGSAPSGAYDVCAHDAACAPPAFLAALRPAPGSCLVLQGREGGLWCQPQTLEQVGWSACRQPHVQ
jgi:hypothetical protein